MAASSSSSDLDAPEFSLSSPRFDQSTYFGRVRHFVDVIDPRMLFVSNERINEAREAIQAHRTRVEKGLGRDPKVSNASLWAHKKVLDGTQNGDERIPVFFRWSGFVPNNIPIVVGMMNSTSVPAQMFWQWYNQSYNSAVNYCNRSPGSDMTLQQMGYAYTGAVAVSCGITFGLNTLLNRATAFSPAVRSVLLKTIPFTAVALAGASNILLVRGNEMVDGIEVLDEEGKSRGVSPKAGQRAVMLSALTRVALPLPVLGLPPVLMAGIDRLGFAKGAMRMPVQVGVIALCLMGALPCAIGLFPQRSTLPVESLEPQFHNLLDSNGQRVSHLFFNRGT